MNRYIFCILFFLLCGLCFGQQGFGINMEFSNGLYSYTAKEEDKYNTYIGIPMNAAILFHNNKLIFTDFFSSYIKLPGKPTIPAEEKYRLDNDHERYMDAVEVYWGFGFFLINTQKFKIPLTAGLHLNMIERNVTDTKSYWINYQEKTSGSDIYQLYDNYLGIGFNLGIQFHMNRKFYLFGKIQGALDFVNFQETIVTVHLTANSGETRTETYSKRNTEFDSSWGIGNQIGFGIRLR